MIACEQNVDSINLANVRKTAPVSCIQVDDGEVVTHRFKHELGCHAHPIVRWRGGTNNQYLGFAHHLQLFSSKGDVSMTKVIQKACHR